MKALEDENHYQIKNGSFLRGSIARAWRRRSVFVATGFQFDSHLRTFTLVTFCYGFVNCEWLQGIAGSFGNF
ncbi:hypothetical protein [Klebsiella quasipneumoniae]|uniref:hypothetical protein n=1 Tax=Klebsiella quasipneumoniae TaxID=1463165 RepID=UPI001495C4F2|nr:hypothetical protein [Klebsiella quasipneumoniae]